jgi:hypothetical protein
MNNSQTKKRGNVIADDQAMIDGITKFLSGIGSLPVGSQTMTPADIVKVFQERIDAAKAAIAAEATRAAAVKADRDERAKTAAFVRAFRRIVIGMFQESPDTLAVFHLTAPKVAKKKVTTKAQALAKSTATRKARNTLGKKAKLKIHGTAAPPLDTTAKP